MVNVEALYGSPSDVRDVSVSGLHVPEWSGCEQVWVLTGLRYGSFFSLLRRFEVPNSSPKPEENFVVLRKDVWEVEEQLLPPERVIGYGHTHPPTMTKPSSNDLIGIDSGMIGAVYCEGSVYWYTRRNRRRITQLSETLVRVE